MINEFTLSILDEIDESTNDSEFYVIESYIDMLNKDIMIFTESSKKKDEDMGVGDRMKEYSKNDSNKFVTVIAFIPRLIAALAKTITSKFAKTGIGKAFGSITKYFADAKDAKEKRQRVKDLNEKLKPHGFEFYYDEVKDKIRLKKSGARFLMLISWLSAMTLTTYNLVKKTLKSIENKDDNALVRLKDDLRRLVHRAENEEKVTKTELLDDSIDSIDIMIKSIKNVGAELTTLGLGIAGAANYASKRALAKDDPKEAEKAALFDKHVSETAGYITKIIGIITATIGSLSVITDWGEMIKDIAHGKINAADRDKVIRTRLKWKGYNINDLSDKEWLYLYKNELKSQAADMDDAINRLCEEKGIDPNSPDHMDYLTNHEIKEKMKDILDEFRHKNFPDKGDYTRTGDESI